MDQKYDALDSWREENGIKKPNGERIRYEGGCEDDSTAEAIRRYLQEEQKKKDEGVSR